MKLKDALVVACCWFLAALATGLIGCQSISRNGESQTRSSGGPDKSTGEAKRSAPRYKPDADPEYPRKLVTLLQERNEFAGFTCYLIADPRSDWRQSQMDGTWFSVLRRQFGENEVSCLLESPVSSRVEMIELQAEFYRPGKFQDAMLAQFAQSAQLLMFPDNPTAEFAQAVSSMSNWSNEKWILVRESHAASGFDLTLRKRR